MRIRSKWNVKDKQRTVKEIAGALGFIVWRIAQQAVLNLENEGYQTETNRQRLQVMVEFLSFSVHIVDRLIFDAFSADERTAFITALAMQCAKHYEDNMTDAAGAGSYQNEFLQVLNERMSDYAEFQFTKQEPDFPMSRLLGENVSTQMGPEHNKWISMQVMDVEVPELMGTLLRGMQNLLPYVMGGQTS